MVFTTAQLQSAILTVDGRALVGGTVELPPNARLLLDVLIKGSGTGTTPTEAEVAQVINTTGSGARTAVIDAIKATDDDAASALRVQQDARLSATYAALRSFDVKNYGAVGDGTADDTAEINAAVTDAAAVGGDVLFPPGTYKTSSSIALKTGTHLRGIGGARIVGSADHDIINDGGTPVTDAAITDLYIEVAMSSTAGSGIELTGCTRVTIRGCEVVNAWDAIDILTGSADVLVTGNHVRDARQQGIQAVASSRVKIQGNIIDGVGTTNLHHCIYVAGGTDVDVSGNTTKGAGGFGVHVYASSGTPTRIAVANNTVTDCGNGSSGTRGGIYAGGTVQFADVTISGNVISDAGGGIGIGAANVQRLTITGNVVRTCGEHGIQVESSSGLAVGFTITGNDVSAYNQSGVGASGLRVPIAGSIVGGVVVGNQFREPSATGGPASIYSSGSADYMLVTGNDLRGGGSLALAGVNNVSANNIGP